MCYLMRQNYKVLGKKWKSWKMHPSRTSKNIRGLLVSTQVKSSFCTAMGFLLAYLESCIIYTREGIINAQRYIDVFKQHMLQGRHCLFQICFLFTQTMQKNSLRVLKQHGSVVCLSNKLFCLSPSMSLTETLGPL